MPCSDSSCFPLIESPPSGSPNAQHPRPAFPCATVAREWGFVALSTVVGIYRSLCQ